MLRLALNPCTPEKRAQCQEDTPNPEHLAWDCAQCKSLKPEDARPYTLFLLYLNRLRQAGFAIAPETLDLKTWHDLGLVCEALAEARESARWQVILKLFMSRSR